MTSVVDICNLSLSHIRGGTINSLTEGSLQSQLCTLKYPLLRNQLLRMAPWQFAHSIKALALLTDTLHNWAYVYQYPSDCLQINRLLLNWTTVESGSPTASRYSNPNLRTPNLNLQVEYKVYNIDGNKVIACNEADIRIDYRTLVEDTNLFDDEFVIAFTHLLASDLAVPIVGVEKGRALRSDSVTLYQAIVDSAIATDANEQHTPIADSEFITVRS